MSGDFVGAFTDFQTNGAEPFTLGPQRIGDWVHYFLDLVRGGGRRGVEVNQAEISASIGVANEQIAHTATHQEEPVARFTKEGSKGLHLLKNRGKAWRKHDR